MGKEQNDLSDPEGVKTKDQELLEEIRGLKKLGRELNIKPGHRTHRPAKGRVSPRKTKVKIG